MNCRATVISVIEAGPPETALVRCWMFNENSWGILAEPSRQALMPKVEPSCQTEDAGHSVGLRQEGGDSPITRKPLTG